MAYQFKSTDIIAPVKISSEEPIFSTETISLKRQMVSQGAQRWVLEFGLAPSVTPALMASLVSAKTSTHTLEMPQIYEGSASTTTLTGVIDVQSNGHSAGETEIRANTQVGTEGLVLGAGRFIKFANHDKVYMVKTGYTVDEFEQVIFDIFPALEADVPTDTVIYYEQDVTFTGRLDPSDLISVTYNDGVVGRIDKITLAEAV